MNSLAIEHGTAYVGDGGVPLEGVLILCEYGKISYIGEPKDFDKDSFTVVDATGQVIIPGIINTHTHGLAGKSPLFSSGSKPLGAEQARANLYRHLSEGTTSILSVDGLSDPQTIVDANSQTPLRIYSAITHTPASYLAARIIDGEGIKKELDLQESLRRFGEVVVAFGEGGSGATLGGGVQNYKFIPELFSRDYGLDVDSRTAGKIKEAVLGRYLREADYDPNELERLLRDVGVTAPIEEVRQKIQQSVLGPFRHSLESITECLVASQKTGHPVMVHTASASKDFIDELTHSGEYDNTRIIAAHSNHSSFELEEAIAFARTLRERGCVIDISTFNTLHINDLNKKEYFLRFLSEGLVDTVTTDYGGGNHSGILEMLNLAVDEGVIGFSEAIKLATYNAAQAIPLMGKQKGLLQEGHLADIVLLDGDRLSEVQKVFIGGKEAYSK